MRSPRSRGFTLLEVLLVVVVGAVVLTLGGLTFSGYFQRSSARRAAQLFTQDLTAARSYAIRSRAPVVIRFHEATLRYEVEELSSATRVISRRFSGTGADIELSGVELTVAGDSLVFTARGIASFVPGAGGLGTATFSSGAIAYTVSFNGMGASKIDQT